MEQISRRTLLTALGAGGATAALAGCSDDSSEPRTIDVSSTHYVEGSDAEPSEPADSQSSSGEPSSGAGSGAMSTVKLAAPEELRGRWAAYTAMWIGGAVSEGGTGPRTKGGDWVYEMELGQWAYLIRFKNGRAVLAGQSNPDISRTPAAEKEERKALLAAGPKWWGVVDDVLPGAAPLGFVMGWDGKEWTRSADAPTNGGFDAMAFYVESDQAMGQQLAMWGTKATKDYSGSVKAAADLVMKAGPSVTVAQLKRLGPGMQPARLPAAVKAAGAFKGKGTH